MISIIPDSSGLTTTKHHLQQTNLNYSRLFGINPNSQLFSSSQSITTNPVISKLIISITDIGTNLKQFRHIGMNSTISDPSGLIPTNPDIFKYLLAFPSIFWTNLNLRLTFPFLSVNYI